MLNSVALNKNSLALSLVIQCQNVWWARCVTLYNLVDISQRERSLFTGGGGGGLGIQKSLTLKNCPSTTAHWNFAPPLNLLTLKSPLFPPPPPINNDNSSQPWRAVSNVTYGPSQWCNLCLISPKIILLSISNFPRNKVTSLCQVNTWCDTLCRCPVTGLFWFVSPGRGPQDIAFGQSVLHSLGGP